MITYLAHPVGQGEDRAKNLINTQKWFLWLFKHKPEWSINVPWFIYVCNLDETHRVRAMRDDLRILGTCDAIVLTGGKISEGMCVELLQAQLNLQKVYDLTKCGVEPPEPGRPEYLEACSILEIL